YVALDEAVTDATVTLRERSAADDTAIPSLDNSSWLVHALRREDGCAMRYQASGYGAGAFVWDGFQAGPYLIEAWRGPDRIWSGTSTADANGRLGFDVTADAINGLEIRVSCAGRSDGT